MSDREELRDARGRLLGYRRESGGRIEGRDPHGRLMGWYDPRDDETRDPGGRLIGRGDLLNGLILGRC